MTWQEYQEAVSLLYEQMEDFGHVQRNVYIPDLITGQNRQVDTLIEFDVYGHTIKILIDAKFYSTPLDVKSIEEVLALSQAVGADKTVIVAANGFTAPAVIKAKFLKCDLLRLSIEEALDLLVPEKWKMCPLCKVDCLVMDQDGAFKLDNGTYIWWLAGQCRNCRGGHVFCQDCGSKMYIELDKNLVCGCGHQWLTSEECIRVLFFKEEQQW